MLLKPGCTPRHDLNPKIYISLWCSFSLAPIPISSVWAFAVCQYWKRSNYTLLCACL